MAHPPIPATPASASTLVVCAASYTADPITAHAFVLRVPATDTRFTVYADEPDRFFIGATYTMTITDPDQAPLWLDATDRALLRHCLDLVAQRCADAAASAQAGATRPATPPPTPTSQGYLDAEPTPAGYQAMSRMFADEHDRVQRLRHHLDTPPATTGHDAGDPS